MLVLGIDFETQSADSKTTLPTEVGAVLYKYNREPIPLVNETWEKIDTLCEFFWEPDYPKQSEEVIDITNITDDMLFRLGRPRKEVFEKLLPLVHRADVIIAHKISFDRTVLKNNLKAVGLELPEKEWLCTLTNFNWPRKFSCHKLSHLAYEHSILVDPATLHRAENDVDLMMRLIGKYNFEDVLAYARKPWVYLKADVLGPWKDGGTQSGIAKSLGFTWEQVKGVDEYRWPKTWVTRVKEDRVDEVKSKASTSISPFRIAKIEGV